jgi:hypothetical protein
VPERVAGSPENTDLVEENAASAMLFYHQPAANSGHI